MQACAVKAGGGRLIDVLADVPGREERRFLAGLRARAGLTLVEILIAVSLLSCLFIPIWLNLSGSRETIMIGQHDLETLNIVSSFMEQARTFPLSRFAEASDVELSPSPGTATTTFLVAGQAGLPEILLPVWNPKTLQVRYTCNEFPFAPAPDGSPRLGRLLTLAVRFPDSRPGTDRKFPLLIPPEDAAP